MSLTLKDPVTAVPGLTPRCPLTEVEPVLLTEVAARTANLAADPRGTRAWAALASWRTNITPTARTMINPHTFRVLSSLTVVFVVIFFLLLFTRLAGTRLEARFCRSP